MPERIDRVTIALREKDVVISWAARDALIDQLPGLETGAAIRAIFEGVGASSPVQLTDDQKVELLRVIDVWAEQTDGGYEALSDGIVDLRTALIEDVHEAEQQRQGQ